MGCMTAENVLDFYSGCGLSLLTQTLSVFRRLTALLKGSANHGFRPLVLTLPCPPVPHIRVAASSCFVLLCLSSSLGVTVTVTFCCASSHFATKFSESVACTLLIVTRRRMIFLMKITLKLILLSPLSWWEILMLFPIEPLIVLAPLWRILCERAWLLSSASSTNVASVTSGVIYTHPLLALPGPGGMVNFPLALT